MICILLWEAGKRIIQLFNKCFTASGQLIPF